MQESRTRLVGWGAPSAASDSAAAAVANDWARRMQQVVKRCCARCALWDAGSHECAALTGRRDISGALTTGEMRCDPRALVREALFFCRYIFREASLPNEDGDTLDRWTDRAVAALRETTIDPSKLPFRDARLLLSEWVPRFLLRWGSSLRPAARPPRAEELLLDSADELTREQSPSPLAGVAMSVDLRVLEDAHHRLQRIHPLLALLARCGVGWEPEPDSCRAAVCAAYEMRKAALSKREADAHFRLATLFQRALDGPAACDLGRRVLRLREFDEERAAEAPLVRHEWETVAARLFREDLAPRELARLRNEAAACLLDEWLSVRLDDPILAAILHQSESTLRAGVGVDKYQARRTPPGGSGARPTAGDTSMRSVHGDHPDEATLYRYGAGMLDGAAEAGVGAHLLTCRDPSCHRLATAGVLLGHRLAERLAPPSVVEHLQRLLPEHLFVGWRMLVPAGEYQRGAALAGVGPGCPLELHLSPAGVDEATQAELNDAPLVVLHSAAGAPFRVVWPTGPRDETVCLRWGCSLQVDADPQPGQHLVVVLAAPGKIEAGVIAPLEASAGLPQILAILDAAGRSPALAFVAEYTVKEDANAGR